MEDMRGLFFIVKGQYSKTEPFFPNRVSGENTYVGGYDPSSPATSEWYQVMDNKCFHTIACGGDLQKVLRAVKSCILSCKGQAKKYFKHVSEVTSDDYYEVHYLKHTPLSPEARSHKAEGRCPRTSPVMAEMYKQVYTLYGDYYSDEVSEMEDEAYAELVSERPVNKSRTIFNKARKGLVKSTPVTQTPAAKEVLRPVAKTTKETDNTPKLVIPKKKGVKLLRC